MSPEAWELIKALAPAVSVYVAIRVDLAVLKIRMDHVENHIKDGTGRRFKS